LRLAYHERIAISRRIGAPAHDLSAVVDPGGERECPAVGGHRAIQIGHYAVVIEEGVLRIGSQVVGIADNIAVVVDSGCDAVRKAGKRTKVGHRSVQISEGVCRDITRDARLADDLSDVVYRQRVAAAAAERAEVGEISVAVHEGVGIEIAGEGGSADDPSRVIDAECGVDRSTQGWNCLHNPIEPGKSVAFARLVV